MSKHSPGPWRACSAGDCLCGLIWSIPADSPIARALPGNEEEDVRYPPDAVAANARLIAAAPELLEMLKRLAGRQDCTCAVCIEAFALIDRIDSKSEG